MEKAIKDLLQHYNELNLTIFVTNTKETEKGVTIVREIRRASEHFNIKDNYDKVEESKTLQFLDMEKANLMRHAYVMTHSALVDNVERGKLKENKFDKFIQDIEIRKGIKDVYDITSNNHYAVYQWVMSVLFAIDVVTDAKILLFQSVRERHDANLGSKGITEQTKKAYETKQKNENTA